MRSVEVRLEYRNSGDLAVNGSAPPTRHGGGHRVRLWLLSIALGLLVLTPLSLWPGERYGGAGKLLRVANGGPVSPQEESQGLTEVARIYNDWQYTILVIVLGLTLLSTSGLYPVLWALARSGLAGILIALEAGLVFWVVYGGLSDVGMPGLFWHAGLRTQFLAGMGVTLFMYWLLYLLFVPDYEAHRHEPERQVWTRFQPVLEESGLPWLLGIDVATVAGGSRLAWFLAYAGIPTVIALVLPAVLPAVRTGYFSSVVAWPWLLGVALGMAMIAVIVRWRIATRLHELWRQLLVRRLDLQQLRELDPHRLDPDANTKNILVIVATLFLGSYLAPNGMRQIAPPAFSVCVVLGVAATAATWLGMQRGRIQAAVGVVSLALVAMAGALDYEVIVRDLHDRYPPSHSQLLRRLTPNAKRPDAYRLVTDLKDHQKRFSAGDREKAFQDRVQYLNRWARSLGHGGATQERSGKPILVVITTSGGALRAALWTESVLRTLDREVVDFHRHIRLITGASGGMLGASNYVASHSESHVPAPRSIQSDYLTPIAWQLAFRDIVPNAFSPFATSNRGDALEDAWIHDSPGLGRTFAELAPQEQEGLIPSLAFSPMLVEDGRRILISNLPLADLTTNTGLALIEADKKILAAQYEKIHGRKPTPPDDYDLEFPTLTSVSAVDFFQLLGEESRSKLRLASAVRMSATFPFVTSVVTLPTYPPRHVVDAGYYDNYGVNLATAWLASHRKWCRDNAAGVLVVQVRAFRNEKRLKMLDQSIQSTPGDDGSRNVFAGLKDGTSALVRIFPATASLLWEGLQALVIPIEGVAKARESSMFFRNDEQLLALHHVFEDLTGDPNFFRTVIFTCDTLQVGRSRQNVETLNWYIDPGERRRVERNMEPVKHADQTGRDRNDLRLKELLAWWREHGGRLRTATTP